MRRTADPRHYSIPLAMVVLAGLVHAGFEDWLFAVGYYLCVYFWFFAFVLADLVPAAVVAPVAGVVSRASPPSPAGFGAVCPTPSCPTRLCPTDDQIVYQWPGRECGWRPYLSAQCDSPSGAESRCGNDRAVESGDCAGSLENFRTFLLSRLQQAPGHSGVLFASRRRCRNLIRRSGAQVLISAGNFALWNSPVPQILLSRNSLYTSGRFLPRCSCPRRLRDMGGHFIQRLVGATIHKSRRHYRRPE